MSDEPQPGRAAAPGRRLSVADHDRGSTGQRYVYAVVSRRSGGVSVGVNLNPNRACNWRCLYCQVPGLVAGKGPAIDLPVLEAELRALLTDVVSGDFLARRAPGGSLRDVAFSGDGEPTTSPSFPAAVELAVRVMAELGLRGVPLVLITNGTMLAKRDVQAAVDAMEPANGQVWFKLDVGHDETSQRINGVRIDLAAHLRRLQACARRCDTWVQTAACGLDGAPPSESAVRAYLDALLEVAGAPRLKGVLLYTLARPSQQPEAPRLSALPDAWLEGLANRIREQTGLLVRAHGAG